MTFEYDKKTIGEISNFYNSLSNAYSELIKKEDGLVNTNRHWDSAVCSLGNISYALDSGDRKLMRASIEMLSNQIKFWSGKK